MKHFEVSLSVNGAPAVGKTVVIHVEGKDDASHQSLEPGQRMEIGAATIDADGAGAHVFQLSPMAQGNYAIKASFAGDDETLPAADFQNVPHGSGPMVGHGAVRGHLGLRGDLRERNVQEAVVVITEARARAAHQLECVSSPSSTPRTPGSRSGLPARPNAR